MTASGGLCAAGCDIAPFGKLAAGLSFANDLTLRRGYLRGARNGSWATFLASASIVAPPCDSQRRRTFYFVGFHSAASACAFVSSAAVILDVNSSRAFFASPKPWAAAKVNHMWASA